MKIRWLSVAKASVCLVWLSGMAWSQTSQPVAEATALRAGNLTESKSLTRKGENLNAKDENGWAPLHEAVLNGDAASVRYLLKKGADPNVSNRAGLTPLMLAVGDPEKLALLLESGAKVNAVSAEGKSALLLAAAQKRALPAVKLLLRKGAQVNQQDKRGGTALLMAARNGDVETLQLLLERGADTQAIWKEGSVPPENGTNALDLACYSQNAAAVKLLLARGVNMDKRGRPLIFATMHGSLDIAQLLLAAGMPVNVADPLVYTPLIYATQTENGNLELLKLLLSKGADPQAKARDGNTALSFAKRKGWTEAIALLQQAGASE
ncbi:MAG: ankyrin repeat domain-containing protein [Acidobacteria bacterium]|nr:ankyrin repeat domain-containing protein [Acidobacteriota bacterium]MBI3425830.1 ankyrin repeat domain-containing protein [Acidobacteriota bacterium]